MQFRKSPAIPYAATGRIEEGGLSFSADLIDAGSRSNIFISRFTSRVRVVALTTTGPDTLLRRLLISTSQHTPLTEKGETAKH